MRLFHRNHPDPAADAQPLDAVALSLAVWLGLIAGGAGMMRLSEAAASQPRTLTEAASPVIAMQLIPYGS